MKDEEALLAVAPPELVEALTRECGGPRKCLLHPSGRVPLPDAERFVVLMGWCLIVVKRDVHGGALEDARYEVSIPPFAPSGGHGWGATLEAAVLAALEAS